MKAISSCLLAGLIASSTALAVPAFVNYQGYVTDSNNIPIGDQAPVNRKVIFKVYNTATGGDAVWAEEHTATLANGRFSVLLGNGDKFGNIQPDLNINQLFSGPGNFYIGITVDDGDNIINQADTEISPRQQIVSSVFALRAGTADSIASGSDLSISGTDNGLGFYNDGRQFSGLNIGGPVLYGATGGALGTNLGGTQTTALRWDNIGDLTSLGNFAINKNLNVTQNSSITGNLTVNGETNLNGTFRANSGITFPGSGAVNSNFIGTAGNFLTFGHPDSSEDFIGYKDNTFYLRDSPSGDETIDPHLDVGGNLRTGGTFNSTGLATLSGGATISGNTTINGPITFNNTIGFAGEIANSQGFRSQGGLFLYATDNNHGIKYKATFDNVNTNGPVVYGYDGGGLGSVRGTENSDPNDDTESIALQWKHNGDVAVEGNLSVKNKQVPNAEESLRFVRGSLGGSNGSKGGFAATNLLDKTELDPNTGNQVPKFYDAPTSITKDLDNNVNTDNAFTFHIRGDGYSVHRIETDEILIRFDQPFSDIPTVTATPKFDTGQIGDRVFLKIYKVETDRVHIRANTDDSAGGGSIAFDFIAIGPR